MSEAKGFLKDERGNRSSARLSWWITLLFTLLMITIDTFSKIDLPAPAYAFLTTVVMFCGGWCAGPRIMQYVAPQISSAAKVVAEAATHRHDPGA